VINGKDAIEQIELGPPDLVLLDLMMPGLDGTDVLQRIRAMHPPDELPVIVISARDNPSDIAATLDELANDYIIKPFDVHVIRARVRHQIRVKKLFDERRELVRKLEHANRVQKNLLRIASHDLKTPVHNISLVFSLLADGETLSAQARKMLRLGNRSLETIIAIVEDFLELNILHGDDMRADIRPLNLAHVVSDVLLQYTGMADQKHIEFEADLPPVQVMADANQLSQIITNLVSNAIKYSPFGGKVWVQLAPDIPHEKAILHIIDQGVGIPHEERDKLFTPFSKISTKPTAGESSTGIGLWIANELIQLQHGHIGHQTPEEGGCDFWVELPLYMGEAADKPPTVVMS